MSRDVFMKFRYEERDIAHALRLRISSALRGRLEVVLAIGACVVGCVVAWFLTSGIARMVVTGFAGVVVAVVFAMLVVVPKIMFRRRAYRWPTTVDASDEGITVTYGPSARTIAWSDCVVEIDPRICIVQHGDDVLLVPRRAFRNAERESAFLELVERHARRESGRPESGKSMPNANA